MSSRRKGPERVTQEDVASHAATRALKTVHPSADVSGIVTLVSKGKSSVYRLELADGETPSRIIAKRSAPNYAAGGTELRVYREILPSAGLPTVEVYGSIAATPDSPAWLFMEDLGDQDPSITTPVDRRLLSDWLVALHRWSTNAAISDTLRDCGPDGYLHHLTETNTAIRTDFNQPWVTGPVQDVLTSLLRLLDRIHRSWTHIDAICQAAPRALVHGDLVRKNIRVRSAGSESELIVLDWETAGVGVPSIDLKLLGDDLRHYAAAIQSVWPDMTLARVETLAGVGRVFRSLAVLYWQAKNLAHPWCYLPGFDPLPTRLEADARWLESAVWS